MKIMAIDPGPVQSAWVLWDGQAILQHGIQPNDDIIPLLARNHDVLAIEWIESYGMPVGKEVFCTCLWVGRFVHASWIVGKPYELIPRKEVKLHLCNNLRAKDANVRQALIDKVGPQGTKKQPGPTYGIKADCWAALGLALTAYHQELNGAF